MSPSWMVTWLSFAIQIRDRPIPGDSRARPISRGFNFFAGAGTAVRWRGLSPPVCVCSQERPSAVSLRQAFHSSRHPLRRECFEMNTVITSASISLPPFRERFKGTTQEFVFDRSFRPEGTSVVLPLMMVTGSAQIRLQSPLPSRFARSSRSSRWRHRPLTLHASRGFSGVPANQSIDQEFSGNCHSQKRCSRPPVRPSMRRHAKKRNRARHDQARPWRPWRRPAHAQSG
jgi:hypothetical protein